MEWFEMIITLGLLVLAAFAAHASGLRAGKTKTDREWESKIPVIRQEAIKRSRSVIGGQFSEQLAPYLPGFKYKPTEAVFIGKPIDFVIFKGSDDKQTTEVVFVEVKSGEARLNYQESQIKKAILEKRVSWDEFRVPQPLTQEKKPENTPNYLPRPEGSRVFYESEIKAGMG